MVVVSIFRWLLNLRWKEKNENIQIWSRYSLFKNTGCGLPASSSAALMPQCVQNTFKNDIKMAANGQFRAAYRRRESAYVSVRPCGLEAKIQSFIHMTNPCVTFFTPHKLQITSFQLTKLVTNAFDINLKFACSIFYSGTSLSASPKLWPWKGKFPL